MKNFKIFFVLITCFFIGGALSSCSTNPATGRTQFAGLMSPQQEEQVGAQEHPQILEEFGVVQDQALQNYVTAIGQKLVPYTERPDVEYTFTVLDSPVVNAFALPGGYVYVTRGLLALANSEAELAAVMAHEIGHITGRHSAERYSRGVVTSLGASVLAAAVDQTGVSQALGLGADLYLKSYSRDQEHEADTLGIRYLSRAGYDPSAMTSFLSSLQSQAALEAKLAGRDNDIPSYFSTHPATIDRVNKTVAEAEQAGGSGGTVNREKYLRQISGLVYGDTAEQGFIRGNDFVHPGMGFRFSVPDGFRLINQPAQVVAISNETGSIIVFDMAPNKNGQDAATYLGQTWLQGEAQDIERITINGMNAATTSFRGSINGRSMVIRAVAVEFKPQSFARFQIGIPQNAPAALIEDLKRTTYSFERVSGQGASGYNPYQVQLIAARTGDTIQSLSKQMAYDDYQEERFRVLNGLLPRQALVPGQLYKIVK